MKLEDFLDGVNKRHASRVEVYKKKSNDYATEDVLSNFKRVGGVIEAMRINKLPPRLCYCFTCMILKMDRWINLLISSKVPVNESVDDTVTDLHNYIDLTDAVSKEKD